MLCSRLMKNQFHSQQQSSCPTRLRILTTDQQWLARARFFALTRKASWVSVRGPRTAHPRFGPLWRYHVPRIWNRSIKVCKFPVKGKTQNVVTKFPFCLFVVVGLQLRATAQFHFADAFLALNCLHLLDHETLPDVFAGNFVVLGARDALL